MKVNYAMVRTRIVKGPFEGGTLPITPRHSGNATIEFGKEIDWILSVTGRYVGKRILANDLANEQPNLPAYAVYDVRLGEQGQYFEWFFSINNVLNRQYEDFGGIGGFPFGSRIGFNPSPERNYTGGIALRF
jgi:outer membrane receptor protein involved in Fe transport